MTYWFCSVLNVECVVNARRSELIGYASVVIVPGQKMHSFSLKKHNSRCFLYQHVTQPTRYRIGETPNLLDLIITNEEGLISSLEHFPGLGKVR